MKPIKIHDIEVVNPALINQTEIARHTGYTQSYVNQLLNENNVRKNKTALLKIRNAIINIYGNNVRILENEHA